MRHISIWKKQKIFGNNEQLFIYQASMKKRITYKSILNISQSALEKKISSKQSLMNCFACSFFILYYAFAYAHWYSYYISNNTSMQDICFFVNSILLSIIDFFDINIFLIFIILISVTIIIFFKFFSLLLALSFNFYPVDYLD